MVGYGLAAVAVLASQWHFFRRTVLPQYALVEAGGGLQHRWKAQMIAYAWPFAIWGVPSWGQLVSDRWALQLFSSTREVGLFAVLYQLGYYPISIVTSLIVQLLVPVYYERSGDGRDPTRIRQVHSLNLRLMWAALALTLLASVLAVFFHRGVFAILVAPEYREVSWLLPGVVLSSGLLATGQIVSILLQVSVQTRRMIAPRVGVAGIAIGVNVLGAMLYGTPGIVAGGILVSACYLAWMLLLVRPRQILVCSPDQRDMESPALIIGGHDGR
jgi:O-antigen/teichoic acid export membrane protein